MKGYRFELDFYSLFYYILVYHYGKLNLLTLITHAIMKIEFNNPKHEALLNDFASLCRRYNTKSDDYASHIIDTVNTLHDVDSLFDLPHIYHPHPLQGNHKGYFGVNVTKTHRVIFKPNHASDPNFRIDNPKSIKSVIIVEIFKDYH